MNSLIIITISKSERREKSIISNRTFTNIITYCRERKEREFKREKGADLLVLFVVRYTKERVILLRRINVPKRNDGLDGSAKVSAKVAIFYVFFVWTNR
jgi:hypothetical protein